MNIEFSPNQWVHLVVVCDGTYIKFYKNGKFRKTIHGNTTHYDMLLIGKSRYFTLDPDDTLRTFNGIIDEFRIYNRPLSESEIVRLYNIKK